MLMCDQSCVRWPQVFSRRTQSLGRDAAYQTTLSRLRESRALRPGEGLHISVFTYHFGVFRLPSPAAETATSPPGGRGNEFEIG